MLNKSKNIKSRTIKFELININDLKQFKIMENNNFVFEKFNKTFNIFHKNITTNSESKISNLLRKSAFRVFFQNWKKLVSVINE